MKKPRTENSMDDNIGSSDDSDSEVEVKYEKDLAQRPVKKMRSLLPIKTKDGLVERTEECDGKYLMKSLITSQLIEWIDVTKISLCL